MHRLFLIMAILPLLVACRDEKDTAIYYDRFNQSVLEINDDGKSDPCVKRLAPLIIPDKNSDHPYVTFDRETMDRTGETLIYSIHFTRRSFEKSKWMGYFERFKHQQRFDRFLLRKNSSGGYDMLDKEIASQTSFTSPAFTPREKLVETAQAAADLEILPATDSLLPIDISAEEATTLVEASWNDRQALSARLAALSEKYPQSPFVATVTLDSALAETNSEKFSNLLEKSRPILESAPNKFYRNAIWYYDRALDTKLQTDAGKNLAAFARMDDDNREISMNDLFALASSIDNGYIFHTQPDPLLIRDRTRLYVASVSRMRTFSYVRETENILLLIQGENDLVRQRADKDLLIARLVASDPDKWLHATIATTMNASALNTMEHLFLDGYTTAEEIEQNWPMVEERYRQWMEFIQETNQSEAVRRGLVFPYVARKKYDLHYLSHLEKSTAHFGALRGAIAIRHHLLSTGHLPDPANPVMKLLPDGLPADPFSETGDPLRLSQSTPDQMIIYSIGPNVIDEGGSIEFVPSNGTNAPGDILTRINRERRFPFPPYGNLGQTLQQIDAQFPNGLPTDPFSMEEKKPLYISDTDPVYIFSIGPDRDYSDFLPKTVASGSKTYHFPPRRTIQPEVAYDLTNGINSNGDIFIQLSPNP